MTCIIIIKPLNEFSFVTVASDVKCEAVFVQPWPKIIIVKKKIFKPGATFSQIETGLSLQGMKCSSC